MKYKKIITWLPVLIWMAIIFLFSSQNAEASSSTSSFPAEILAKFINPSIDTLSNADRQTLLDNCQFAVRKLAHFSVYTILGIFSYIAFRGYERISPKLKVLLTAALCLLYAASDEIHQYFVPGRSCHLRDVIIDFSGSVFGIVIVIAILAIIRKMKKSRTAQ